MKEGHRVEKDSSEVEPYKVLGREQSTHSEKLKLLNENEVFR